MAGFFPPGPAPPPPAGAPPTKGGGEKGNNLFFPKPPPRPGGKKGGGGNTRKKNHPPALKKRAAGTPNPATLPAGKTVVWHNVDTTIHRVVLNNGQLDTGNLSPGAFSAPMTLGAPGPYHCSIHPDMVGTLQGGQ